MITIMFWEICTIISNYSDQIISLDGYVYEAFALHAQFTEAFSWLVNTLLMSILF
jgi:hypothetical protein